MPSRCDTAQRDKKQKSVDVINSFERHPFFFRLRKSVCVCVCVFACVCVYICMYVCVSLVCD